MIGGWLSDPYDRYPNTFGKFEFWKNYPYALPCFVIAFYCITAWILAFFCLEEVRIMARKWQNFDTEDPDRPASMCNGNAASQLKFEL
jgi:hypothetical protein